MLSDALTDLNEKVFENCSGLTGTLIIPDSVKTIDEGAFSGCNSLSAIVFGTGLKTIVGCYQQESYDDWMWQEEIIPSFYGCSGVTALTFTCTKPPAISDASYYSYSSSEALEDFFGSTCFSSLTEVIVPLASYSDYIEEYGEYLQSQTRLHVDSEDTFIVSEDGVLILYNGAEENVTLPETVTAIGENAFRGNSTLKSVEFSSGLTAIDANAFRGCAGLTSVTFSDALTSIGANAFRGCTALTGVTFPDTLETIGEYAFYGCTGLTGSLSFPSALASIGAYAFYGCTGLNGTLTFSVGLTSIGNSAFYNCSGLTGSLSLPKGLESIGSSAFYGCSGLNGTLSLPTGIESIGSSAFRDCSGLTGDLKIPDGITALNSSVFYGCSGFNGTLSLPDSLTTISMYAFYGCSGLTGSLSLPSAVTSISTGAFYNCSGFTGTLTLPKSLTSLGDFAFRGCTGFTGSLTVPSGVKSIGSYAFYGCTGLNGSLNLPEGLTSIGSYAFYNCTGLSGSLVLPKTLITINSYAFAYCSGFTGSLTIPDTVKTIGNSAFYKCTGFAGSLTLSQKLTAISASAFQYCTGITGTLQIPDSVQTIAASAFAGCTGLEKVIFGSGLTNLVATTATTGSFYGCSNVTRMTFTGSTVPAISNTTSASSGSATYIGYFFSSTAMAGLTEIFVPEEAVADYQEAWGSSVPDGVSIAYGLDLTVSNLRTEFVYSHSVGLTWTASIYDEVIGYRVYRDGDLIAAEENTAFTSYKDTELEADTTYVYTVVGYTEEGIETETVSVSATTSTPQVQSVYTNIDAEDGAYKVVLADSTIYAEVTDTGNLDTAVGIFTCADENGAVRVIGLCDSYASKTGSTAIYAVEWDLSAMEDEAYVVSFSLTDADHESGSLAVSVTVDTSRPAALSSVAAVGDTNKIVLSWSISHEVTTTNYHIYRRAEDEDDFTLVKTIYDRDTQTWTDTDTDVEQKYYYYVVGVDPYGLEGEQSAIAVATPLTDTEAPTVVQLTPVTGSIIGGDTVLYAQAKDNVAVTATELYLSEDGESWTLLASSDTSYCSYTLSTSVLKDETIYVKALAYDAAGNVSNSLTGTYRIDNTGPEQVTGLTLVSSTATTITLGWNDVADEDFSFFRVEQLVDGAYVTLQDIYTTLGVNIYKLESGTEYTYRVVAYDQLGNRGTASDDITVSTLEDTVAPVVTAMKPDAGYYNGTITLKITATDNTGIVSVKLQTSANAILWEDLETLTYDTASTSVTVTKALNLDETDESGAYVYDEGSLYIRAVATDGFGNESDTSGSAPYVQYIVDRTAPETPQDFAADTSTTGAIQLTWTQGGEDDLDGYRIYRSTDGENYTLLVSGLYTVNYWDRSVEANTTYWYQLAVTDEAGNVRARTDAVQAAVVVDEEAPVIQSYAPTDGSTVGTSNAKFSVLVSDNWKVDSVTVTYTVNDSEDVNTLISKTGIDYYYKLLSATIPVSSLSDGDVLHFAITVTDVQGLETSADGITYTVDRTAPRVNSVTAEGDYEKITVQWTGNAESDLAGYRVYRKAATGSYSLIATRTATGATEFTYEDYNAQTKQTYYYKVEAVDSYGNTHTRESEEAYLLVQPTVTAALTCETTLDVDTEYCFDASASSADRGIAAYQFDFGDGTVVESTTAKVIHKYAEMGTYTLTLTVTDASTDGDALTQSISKTITVTDPSLAGTVHVTVVDGDGQLLTGIPVYFDLENYSDIIKYTNTEGYVEFSSSAGSYAVGSYESGYLPVMKTISIGAGAVTEVELVLVEQPIVTGEFEITRMTLDEIIAAGIDVTDPANQNVVQVTIHLTYGTTPVTLNVLANTDGICSPGTTTVVDTDSGPRELSVTMIQLPEAVGGSREDDEEEEEDETLIAILDIPVEISYLKEFFDVKLHILNHASEQFELTDNVVKLNVPEGLTLMDTDITDAKATITFDSLQGQEQKTLEWILRGDVAGEYTLSADYSGTLSYFDADVTATFVANNPITVYGLNALKLIVEVAKTLDDGDLYFNLSLENTGAADIYLPTIDITDNLISEYVESSETDSYDMDLTVKTINALITDADGNKEYLGKEISPSTLAAGAVYTKKYVCYDVVYSDALMSLQEASATVEKDLGLEVEIRTSGNLNSNVCGESLTWSIEDGVLEISGSGAMYDWTESGAVPWQYLTDEITSIMIGTNVTTIGSYAFSACTNAVSVRIPESMDAIGMNAFLYCSSLTDVYYCSTENNWNTLADSISSGNNYLLNATKHYLEFDKDSYIADQLLDEETTSAKFLDEALTTTSPSSALLENLDDTLFGAAVFTWDSLSNIYSAVNNPFTIGTMVVEQKDIYSAIILNALEASVDYNNVSSVKSVVSDVKGVVSQFTNILKTEYFWETADMEHWDRLSDVKKEEAMSAAKEAFESDYPLINKTDKAISFISDVLDVCKTVEDFEEKTEEILIIMTISDSMETVLQTMYNESTDSAMRSALKDCLKYIDESEDDMIKEMLGDATFTITNEAFKIMGKYWWKNVKNKVIKTGGALSVLMLSYNGATMFSNAMLGTDDLSEAYGKMLAIRDVENLLKRVMETLKATYQESGDSADASAWLSAIDLLFAVWDADCTYAFAFVEVIDDAWVTKIGNYLGISDSSERDEVKKNIASTQEYYTQMHEILLTNWLNTVNASYEGFNLYEQYQSLLDESEERLATKTYLVACPVDVYVYDAEGNLIASVIDSKAYTSGTISIAVENETKMLYFYDNEEYTIKCVGTDTGTMDITVTEYDSSENSVREVYFSEVALTDGLTYTMDEDGTMLEDADYELKEAESGETVAPDLDTLRDGMERHTLKTIRGYMLTDDVMTFSFEAFAGETTTIYAYVPEGYEFDHWTSSIEDETGLFEDAYSATTTVTMPDENVTVTAALKEAESETEAETEIESETETEIETESETEFETESESETEAESETQSEPETESESETEAESETQSEP
ncbi:MAG: leucine-rich repeat protein, partial [Lachnospiraceae bacterium]|nr:leucine-rich repeat protein [Lachnospiraceae bacterium]